MVPAPVPNPLAAADNAAATAAAAAEEGGGSLDSQQQQQPPPPFGTGGAASSASAAEGNGGGGASRRKKSRWGPPSAPSSAGAASSAAMAERSSADGDKPAAAAPQQQPAEQPSSTTQSKPAAANNDGNNNSSNTNSSRQQPRPKNRWGSPLGGVAAAGVLPPPPYGYLPPPPPPPGHPAHHPYYYGHPYPPVAPPPVGYPTGGAQQRPSSRSGTGSGKSSSSGSSSSSKTTAAPRKRASPRPKKASQAAAAAKSKAARAAKSKPRAKRPRSSPQQSEEEQQQPQPQPPVGPAAGGYGPVGPPPLPYHEAQFLALGLLDPDESLHDHDHGMPRIQGRGGVNGDDRTTEWEAHAEALALGLGLLDDGADDPTCSGGDGSHDAYLQHGPPPAAEAETEGERRAAEAGETTGGACSEGSSQEEGDLGAATEQPAENESAPARDAADAAGSFNASDVVPVLTLEGYRPRSSKAAAAGNDVRQQFAEANQCYDGGAEDASTHASLHRAKREEETVQEREERRRTQLRERLGRRRPADGSNDDQEREFQEDLAGVWYPCCSWIGAGREGSGGVGTSAGAEAPVAAVVDPSTVVGQEGRKRSRPAGSVSFSLGNGSGIDGRDQEPAQLQQQVLQSLPSSSDLLSDPAYIDLVCGPAAKGEACKSLLASLLNAMGMELPQQRRKTPAASRSSSATVLVDAYARPMREGKKPVQTPGTVREFAVTLISMGVQSAASTGTTSSNKTVTVLDEVAAAFRLACHHVLCYVASALANSNASSRDNRSPVRRKRATKVSEFARRAYMTLFVTLRGLIVRVVDRPDSAESMCNDATVLSFFVTADDSFSSFERLLLDIVPLLTRFAHPPLHDKHSTSLVSNLLLLDESTRKKKSKKSKDPSSADIVMVRDGLMELFVRQLADQEDLTERRLRKVLNVSSTHMSDAVGAAASLNDRPSDGCILVSDAIVEYRRRQQGELQAIARRKASASSNSGLAAGSATAVRSVSSSWDAEDATSGAAGSASGTDTDNDLRLVRIDGCIYLSKIISRLLDSRPSKSLSSASPPSGLSPNNSDISAEGGDGAGTVSSSSATSAPNNFAASSELKIKASEEKLRVHDAQKIEEVAQTAYFLFHTLVESHADAGSFPRKNVSSAVLACFLLAGKMEDCPLKLRTILRITKNATLPPPPFETIRQCYDKLAPNAPGALPMKWGEPSADLIKQFEFSLLTTLGFVMPERPQSLHPTASIVEIKNKLALDSNTIKHVQRLMKDPCYTHSSLCLLREPQLMAAALYYLSCQKGRSELLKDWDLVLEEEAVVVKVVADYSRWVGHCVKYRERQWNVFKALKYRVNAKAPDSSATATAAHSSRTPENAVDDSLAVWSRTIPPISEFESPPLLPMELSTVTEKINGILSAPNAEESSSPDEVQDEDYLTIAALLEIPDDAVEESDTSPSANSVDSIAVLMDSRSKEKSSACSKKDSSDGGNTGDAKEDVGNETTIVVSPALGDERHDAVLSEDATAQASVAADDTQESDEKSIVADLKHASASPKDTRRSKRGGRVAAYEQGPTQSVESVGDDAAVARPSNAAAGGADLASAVPFSPIRRKSIPSPTGKSEDPGREVKIDIEVPNLVEAAKQKDVDGSEKIPDPISSPLLAAKPAPALPPAPASPKRKLLMKAAEDAAAAEAEAEATSAAATDKEAAASNDAAESSEGSDDVATSESTMVSQTSSKSAESAKMPSPIALPPAPKVSNLDVSKVAATKTDAASTAPASKLLTSPEPCAKKNDVPPKAITPRRAAAASSLLELKVLKKVASKLASSADAMSREGSPVPPKEDSVQTQDPPRRATRSTVKAGKSPEPDAKGLGKKSASRKRKAISKKSSIADELPLKPFEQEEKEKAGTSRAEPKCQSQALVSSTSRPLKKRAVSTTNAPVGADAITAVPTGTTPSWYPAPDLQRLEAKAKSKGRGKKRDAQEASSSKATPQAKSATPSVKRRRSQRTVAPEAPGTSPESRSTQKKLKKTSSASASSKEVPSVVSDAPAPLQKGRKKDESNSKAAPVAETIDADDDATFPLAGDNDDGGDGTTHEAEHMAAKARALYDFTTANLKKTTPLYKNDLFRLEDKNEQPLICELASLHREAAIHFIDTMRRKPDAFWLNENVVTKAAEAFWFQLPPRVQTEEARHLYRNFADSPDNLRNSLTRESSDKPLRLRLSRREVDIMLYFASKGQTAMDCHYLMPYRSRRKMREVFETIKTLVHDAKEEYMTNVTATVEALIAIEGPGDRKEDTQNLILLC